MTLANDIEFIFNRDGVFYFMSKDNNSVKLDYQARYDQHQYEQCILFENLEIYTCLVYKDVQNMQDPHIINFKIKPEQFYDPEAQSSNWLSHNRLSSTEPNEDGDQQLNKFYQWIRVENPSEEYEQ